MSDQKEVSDALVVKNREWIAEQLGTASIVEWDRFIVEDHDGTQRVEVYGWINRDDDYKDFVIVRFWPENEEFGYTTSSDEWTEWLYNEWFDHDDLSGHNECRRVEHAFDVENVVELTKDADLGEFA